jgi:hypothetical protein
VEYRGFSTEIPIMGKAILDGGKMLCYTLGNPVWKKSYFISLWISHAVF